MAPSLFSAATSALLFSAAAQATKSYQLFDTYDSTNFLDKFSLFESDHTTGNYNDVDPTSGFVSYKGRAEAEELGILKTIGDEFYLGVDAKTTLDAKGVGRSSVRLESKAKYNKGLYIADFTHFPKPTCGTWPAFWTVGQPWPSGGEVDIYESWNLDAASRIVMHTDAKVGQCGISGEGMTAEMGKPNCAGDAPGQGSGEGCAGLDSAAPYASDKGGVYAMEWTDDSIKVWAFTHDQVPADLAENPNPETWGLPRFASAACEVDKVFDDAQIIMNINFCGVAGHEGFWYQCAETTKQTSCQAYIAENPEAFKDTYFQVRSIKIYTLGDKKTEDTPSAAVSEATEPTATDAAVSSALPEKPVYTDLPEGQEGEATPSAPSEPEKPVYSDLPEGEEGEAEPSTSTEPEKPVYTEVPGGGEGEQTPPTSVGPETPVYSDLPEGEEGETEPSSSVEPEKPVYTEVPGGGEGEEAPSTSVEPEAPEGSNTPEEPTVSESGSSPDYPVETESVSIETTESVLPIPPTPTSAPITSSERLTTLTISETRITTITSCPPEAAAECPGKVGEVVTEVIAVTTTVCPVTDVPTVITVSKTIVNTVTSCAPEVLDCPGEPSTTVEEEVITTSTAIPVFESSPVPVPEPTPETPAPEEPTPEEPTPEEPTPEEPTPEEPTPEEPTPEEPTPEEPTPEEPTPEEPTPEQPTPEEPTPEVPTPEVPTPEEPETPTPEEPAPQEPTPTITSERLTTLTISETRISTITACPPEAAADCPGKIGSTVTEVVGVTTTVCPVIDVPTTFIVSKTIVNTITSCAPEVTDCPVGQPSTTIEQETITTTTPVAVLEPTPEPTPEEPTPEQPTPEEPGKPEEPIPEEPIPEQPTPEEPTPEVPTPEQPTPEQPTPEEPAPEEPTPEQPTPEEPTPEEPTPEEPVKPEEPVTPTPEEPVKPEEPTPEQPTPEEPVKPEEPTPEEPVTPTPEEPVKPEEPTPEQPTPEEPVPEQPTPEYPVPEQPTPEEPVPEQPVPEEPVPQPPSPTVSQDVPLPPPAVPTFTSIFNGTQTAPVTFPTGTDVPVEVDAASKLGTGGMTLLAGAVIGVVAFVL
ncbi:hypothetical protein ACHAQA_007163 [Verticillium albo-atrum]